MDDGVPIYRTMAADDVKDGMDRRPLALRSKSCGHS
jgi:hypothetical protein